MNIPENAERVELTVAGRTVQVASPYSSGHVLSEEEANVLNQTYRENIRNNCAKEVKALKSDEEAQAAVDAYVESYEFGARRGGPTGPRDPVTSAAMDIARNAILRALKKNGVKRSEVSASDITERAKKLVEEDPRIRQLAEEKVAKEKALEASILEVLAD